MDASHRISTTSLVHTVSRQTPKNDFGQVLARTAGEVARVGAGFLPPALSGGAVSAVVSGIRSVTSMTAAATSASGAVPLPAAGGSAGAASGQGEQWDLLEAQKALNAEGQRFSATYLQLQNEMQKESRQFTAVSNIMKVRHDSAKAAINNIR
jgi:hypothetical protein